MNASRKLLLVLSLSLSAFTFAPLAHASDAATAEALFDEARRLMTQGNFAAACPQLEESQKLDPGMGTLYNLADCYEKTGRIASAWGAFLDVAAQAKNANQASRESDARARAAALEPKVSKLTIIVEGALAQTAGVEVKRDAIAVGKAQWGLALPVDPGEHTLEVSAPGKTPWSGKVQVASNGSAARVALPALVDAPIAIAPTAAPTLAPESGDSREPNGKSQRTIGLVVAGVGVAAIGVGGIFGLMSIGKGSDADDPARCDSNNQCDAAGIELRKDARSLGNLSTVFVIAGAALGAGGAALFFTAPKSDAPRAAFAPVVLPGGGGFSLNGSFR